MSIPAGIARRQGLGERHKLNSAATGRRHTQTCFNIRQTPLHCSGIFESPTDLDPRSRCRMDEEEQRPLLPRSADGIPVMAGAPGRPVIWKIIPLLFLHMLAASTVMAPTQSLSPFTVCNMTSLGMVIKLVCTLLESPDTPYKGNLRGV